MNFSQGDKVQLKHTPRNYSGQSLTAGRVYTVSEVHAGNFHTPDQMVSLEGVSSCFYAWRFILATNEAQL